jgi:hypothetical protein
MANEANFGIDLKPLLEGLKKVQTEYGSLNKSVKDGAEVNIKSFEKLGEALNNAFKEGEKALSDFANNSNKHAKDIEKSWGNAFSRIAVLKDLIPSAVGFVGNMISGPMQLEKSMNQLAFVSKDVKQNFSEVQKTLSKMGNSMPIKDTNELVLAMKDLATDGFNVKDSYKLIEEASRGAVAGNTDVGASVSALKNIIGAYGLEVGKSAEIQDKLFKASQMTGEAYGNIASSMSGAITNVASLGVSFDSFLGSVTALTKMNTPLAESINLMDMASKQLTASLGSAYMETHSLTDTLIDVYEKAGGEYDKIIEKVGKPELARAVLKIGQNANAVRGDLV